jgi:hypothetical protein
MASGHVNRTNRPNTWLHRPATQREDFPCQLGAVHTWHIAASDLCDGTSAVGESRHRIPGASVGQPTEPCLGPRQPRQGAGGRAGGLSGPGPLAEAAQRPSYRLPWALPWQWLRCRRPRDCWRFWKPPHPWHSRAGGGAVHSIICGLTAAIQDRTLV